MASNNMLMDTKNTPRDMEQGLRDDMAQVKIVMSQIEGRLEKDVHEWWSGKSARTFLSRFSSTRKSLDKGLDVWVTEEVKYVNDIAKTILQQDQEDASNMGAD